MLCLLTGQTARAVRDEPALQHVIPRLLDEANAVGQSCIPAVKRLIAHRPRARAQAVDPAGLRARPRHGDRRAGARAGSVCARRQFSTPMLDLIAGLAIQRARDKGLYKPG